MSKDFLAKDALAKDGQAAKTAKDYGWGIECRKCGNTERATVDGTSAEGQSIGDLIALAIIATTRERKC